MKKFVLLFLVATLCFAKAISSDNPIIIDHSCTQLNQVPDYWVEKAKSTFRLAYGHTSHGSQIVSGMTLLESIPNSIYTVNDGESSLYLNDGSLLKGDLGNPDRETWASRTRDMLTNNTQNINMVMWSWCGQVDGSVADINKYLNLMDELETEFPSITFVYMTGHLDGSGEDGNVNQRNEQIRTFCKENNKILFDFADIESYDPDGNYFLDKDADDQCNYDGGNWADEWCAAHPGECEDCSCAHSKCINCQQKGKAFWWMMARIAGWDGLTSIEETNTEAPSLSPNPANDYIEISYNLNRSESYFNRRVSYLNRRVNPTAEIENTVKIYNSFGENIKINGNEKSHSGNSIRIDISALPAGIYFVKIGSHSEKFVVVR